MDTRSKHLLKVGIVANVFEWYEFSIFAALAGFIGKLFFTADYSVVELLYTYSVFALSCIARPLGGIFFGRLGDRMSRGRALRLSLILMSVPTIVIGALPTYHQAGIMASVSLLILRLMQGFAAGGELPMTACYVFEASPAYNRGFLCSIIAISPKLGMLLASLVTFCLIRLFDEPAILDWAWRIPFLLGVPLTLFIIYLRKAIEELGPIQQPISKTALNHAKWSDSIVPIFQAISLVSFGALYYYVMFVWMPSYLIYFFNIPSKVAHLSNTLRLCAILPLYGLVHYFSNYFGYRKLLLGSMLCILALVVPVFKLMQVYPSWQAILILQLVLSLAYVGFDGVLIETLGELFPPTHRSLSFGFAWTIAAALIGGTTPLVCTYVIHKTGWLMFPAFYMVIVGCLALPAGLALAKNASYSR